MFKKCGIKLLLRFEGMRHRHKNKKSFNNIDLSKYLDEIKDAENENALIIAIKDSVIETLRLSGDENSISVESYFTKRPNMVSAVEFISKWSEYGAQICNYVKQCKYSFGYHCDTLTVFVGIKRCAHL